MLFASIAFSFLASLCFSPVAVHGAPLTRRDNAQLCTGTDGSGFCSGFLGGQCFNLGGGGQFSLTGDLTGCKGFPAGSKAVDIDQTIAGNLIGKDLFSFQCGGNQ
ncbi:hypothetical protein B0H14DRAFT_2689020 [Mycena olivaceomarginata]|nr:hypothetical protein B0H14DRAFT_2689020 [Mycena olivaceomarginata]